MAGATFGGSEELWTRTAALLAKQGVPVAASVHGWPKLDSRISALSRVGVDLRPRPVKPSLISLVRRYISGKPQLNSHIERSFGGTAPGLVVISTGSFASLPIELVEMCIAKAWPFAILAHSNFSGWWPSDMLADRLRKALPLAKRCFFVSEANRAIAEKQLGYEIANADIIRNPITVDAHFSIPWPPDDSEHGLRMASVGNLYPTEKGQDILLEILAKPAWLERKWRLTFYGKGQSRDVLERLIDRFKLRDRVSFAGYVAAEDIWRENHLLVMPSRYEGGPMTTIEAMFCARPVVATNVGSNPEFIKDGITGFLAEIAAVECFGAALERMWGERDRLQDIGRLGAADIRQSMPADPVGIFAEKLKTAANA